MSPYTTIAVKPPAVPTALNPLGADFAKYCCSFAGGALWPMDRATEEAHLALAKRHVIDAERRIDEQRERCVHLASIGAPTELASALLSSFEGLLVLMQDHREHIERSLADRAFRSQIRPN